MLNVITFLICIPISIRNPPKLGCLKNTKSLKSEAPQGFSGCLDIENDEMNKKKIECIS